MKKVFRKSYDGRSYIAFLGNFESTLAKSNGIDVVITSPPYNIGSKSEQKITNRKSGGYDAKSFRSIRDYPDMMPEDEYQKWQSDTLSFLAQRLSDSGIIAYNHKKRHKNGLLISPESWIPSEIEVFDEIIWDRCSTHNHTKPYVSQQHEYIFLLRKKGKKHHFNKGFMPSVIRIAPDRDNKHNAPMPLQIPLSIIGKFAPDEGLICDPFLGSGTTMVAAMLSGLSFVGSEKQENYFNMSVNRFLEAIS